MRIVNRATAGRLILVACGFCSAFLLMLAARGEDAPKPASAEPPKEQLAFFESKIRPVLEERCYSCHSAGAKKLKAEYLLDTREGLRKGGESGDPAVVPGDPDKSPLILAIRRTDEDFAMPPKEERALSAEQVKDFEEWVKMGAPDPRAEAK